MNHALVPGQFHEKGVLTPEEFVAAGDLLVFKCPTWSWSGAEEGKERAFLPPDKQFLVTRNVPCTRRAATFEYNMDDEMMVDAYGGEFGQDDFDGGDDDGWGDGWVATHISMTEEVAMDMNPTSTSGGGNGGGFGGTCCVFFFSLIESGPGVSNFKLKLPHCGRWWFRRWRWRWRLWGWWWRWLWGWQWLRRRWLWWRR